MRCVCRDPVNMTVSGHVKWAAAQAAFFPVWVGVAISLGFEAITRPGTFFQKKQRVCYEEPPLLPKFEHSNVPMSDGVNLHVVTSGLREERPLILFLHGFPESWHSWRHQMQDLASDNAIAALDMRGFGDSDMPQDACHYGMSRLVHDIVETLAHLGRKNCILVGHDWGGMVAWHVASHHPELVSGLITVDSPHPRAYADPDCFTSKQARRSWYFMLFQAPRLAQLYLSHSDFQAFERMLTRLPKGVISPGAITQKDVERVKHLFGRKGALKAALNYYVANFDNKTRRPDPLLPECLKVVIAAPVLVLHGVDDFAFLPSMFKGYTHFCANVETMGIPACSHWAQQDRPQIVTEAIREFCARLQKNGPVGFPDVSLRPTKTVLSQQVTQPVFIHTGRASARVRSLPRSSRNQN